MDTLKRGRRKFKRWAGAFYDRHWLKIAVVVGMVFLLGMGWMVGSTVSTHQQRHRAEQAEKRLEEMKEEHAAEIQRLEVEFDLELDRRIEQARLDAQAEMAEQLAALNQQLEEEQQAYADLEQALNDLESTYQELMDTVFGPDWDQTMLPITDPLEATVILAGQAAWYFTDNVDEYLEWETSCPPGYRHLVNTGRAVLKGEHTYPMSPGFREASIIAAIGEVINAYLARRRSPLAGYGANFAREGRRYGINPYLLVALTGKESTFATDGSLSRTNHNAWGMLGPNRFTKMVGIPCNYGACWWPDWPSAIAGAACFLDYFWPNAQTAYDCRGYCVGNPSSWIQTVEAVRNQLGGVV